MIRHRFFLVCIVQPTCDFSKLPYSFMVAEILSAAVERVG